MKTIGLLGGTGWASTIDYYRLLNQLVQKKLGGHHSAKILLKSIDYHDIMSSYGTDPEKIAAILKKELQDFLLLKPDCLLICCNSLHKFYDMIHSELACQIPIFHAVDLSAQYTGAQGYNKVLLLASKFTMDDGFFAEKLRNNRVEVVTPSLAERVGIHQIHLKLLENKGEEEAKRYFDHLILKYIDCDAIMVACTEYSPIFNKHNFTKPIIDSLYLQCESAVKFSLKK